MKLHDFEIDHEGVKYWCRIISFEYTPSEPRILISFPQTWNNAYMELDLSTVKNNDNWCTNIPLEVRQQIKRYVNLLAFA